MIRTILSICILGAFGVLAVALIQPELATSVTDRVLSTLTNSDQPATISGATVGQTPLIPIALAPYLSSINQGSHDSLTTEGIIAATNKERIAAGLAPLTTSSKLVASAKIKVDDMIARQYFEHVSPTGKNVSDLGSQVGYDYVAMGENLALGDFDDANDLLTAWMNSPGHRANILNAGYREMGAYAFKASYNGRTVWFAVQHFGTPRTVCPTIDATLKSSIASLNKILKQKEAIITAARAELETPEQNSGEVYKAKVAAFNTLVSQYNALLAVSQKQISVYNKQVAAFNNCLTVYQKDSSAIHE
jgi:uncharacterized protein YkwD